MRRSSLGRTRPAAGALALAMLLAPGAIRAQSAATDPAGVAGPAAPTLAAERLTGSVDLDGRLDEPAWRSAPAATEFTQSYPKPGEAPTQRTDARVLYSNDALYVGVRMYDTHPDSIAAQLARRDASGIYSDWLHVIVGSYHDQRTALRFSVNPRGVLKDVLTFDDGNEDANWDAVWEAATRVDSLGWTAELRIPLSQLPFSGAEPAGGRVWDLHLMRDIARYNERDSWSPWTPNDPGFVSRSGRLVGLVGLDPVRRVELLPYASSRLTRAPGDGADPFYRRNDLAGSIGADLKLGLTPGVTLTGTVNPDFGQVEVDPAVVNLSAFETFFEEKRPFFMEGSNIFRFGDVRTFNDYGSQEYFYSRRIGRPPQRALSGDTLRYVEGPDQSTILGAAKVSGKAGRWTLGLMNALTAEERAHYLTASGTRGSAPVEPRTDYFVGRVRREMRGGATMLGSMVTLTARDMAGGAFAPMLRSQALFGGIDGEHAWANRRWTLSGFLSGSRVSGSRAVIAATQRNSQRYFQRPDAGYLSVDPDATSLAGYMGELALMRSGDWDLSLAYKETSPGYEINDLGFQNRTDARSFSTFLGRRRNHQTKHLRSNTLYGYTYHVWNFGGTSILQGVGLGTSATTNGFWNGYFQAGFQPPSLDDRLTRGGPLARRPARWSVSGGLSSDARHALSVRLNGSYDRTDAGGWSASLSLPVDFRPSSAVRLQLGPELDRSLDRAQYVTAVDDPLATGTFGTRYVFADLHQTTASLVTRLDWTFSPALSLQLYAQPFVAVGDYRDFKEFLHPRRFDFGLYGEERGTLGRGDGCDAPGSAGADYLVDPDAAGPAACFSFAQPDFNLRSLRGDAVLRWEYRPGSVLYFVWQQQRQGYAAVSTFDLGHDAGEIFRAPARNVFLVKATYWVGR